MYPTPQGYPLSASKLTCNISVAFTAGVGWQQIAAIVHKGGRPETPDCSLTTCVIGVGTGEESRSNLGMRDLHRSLLRQRLDLIVLQRLARTESRPGLEEAITEVQRKIELLEAELGHL